MILQNSLQVKIDKQLAEEKIFEGRTVPRILGKKSMNNFDQFKDSIFCVLGLLVWEYQWILLL